MEYRQLSLNRKEKVFGAFELFMLISIVLLMIINLFDGYVVVGRSMYPTYNYDNRTQQTLRANDEVLVSKYIYSLKKQDIVVFRFSGKQDPFIKRIIAMPGETFMFTLDLDDSKIVRIKFKVGDDWGEPLQEDYILEPMLLVKSGWYTREYYDSLVHNDGDKTWAKTLDYEITVPDGHYFVMGDNRNDSSDSREFGFMERDRVCGKVVDEISSSWLSRIFIGKNRIVNYH